MESGTDLLEKVGCRVMAVYFLTHIVHFIYLADNYIIYISCPFFIFYIY